MDTFETPETRRSARFLKKRKNGRTAAEKWQPQTWKPEYETVVSCHARGMTNKDIAQLTGFTPMQISNILTCEHAKYVKQQIIEGTRQYFMEKQEIIVTKATERIESFMNNDYFFMDKPIPATRIAMDYLKMTELAHESPTQVNNQQNIIIGDEAIQNLIAGLNKSNRAKEIHAEVTGDSIN